MRRERIRLLAGFALAFVLAAIAPFAASQAFAQEDDQEDNQLASITIYTAICPTDYAGDDFFEDCFDNPGADITYFLDESTSATTGPEGFAAFEGISVAGQYLLQIDVPGEFTDFVAFCSDEFGDPFEFTYATDVGGIILDLTLDDDIRCDFYVIPLSADGGTTPPAPTQAPATSTVGALPSTGAGPDGGERGAFWPLAWALVLLVVAGGSLAMARGRVVATGARARR